MSDDKPRYSGVTGTARMLFRAASDAISSDKPKKRNPRSVPMGSGIADRGKKTISGRQRQIDSAVDEAQRGNSQDSSLRDVRRPSRY